MIASTLNRKCGSPVVNDFFRATSNKSIFVFYKINEMNKSTITIDVVTDENKVPEAISWSAPGTNAENAQKAKAMMIAFWDAADKAALRIDLWTKDMMVDEMADFFYQTLMTMADTYGRATKYNEQVDEMKKFAKGFYENFRARQLKENKAD
jgi:gliding motility-associated protein GldC